MARRAFNCYHSTTKARSPIIEEQGKVTGIRSAADSNYTSSSFIERLIK
jgi:hypothetical protein